MTRIETAEAIASKINADGRATANVWTRNEIDAVRVYVNRELSRGRMQECGYYDVDHDGVSSHITRNRAHFDRIVAL